MNLFKDRLNWKLLFFNSTMYNKLDIEKFILLSYKYYLIFRSRDSVD